MSNHRCTRCKEDVGPHGIRHKAYMGGLFCERCMRYLQHGVRRHIPGFWGKLWHGIVDIYNRVVGSFQHDKMIYNKRAAIAYKVAYNSIMNKARDIPIDAITGAPQKR